MRNESLKGVYCIKNEIAGKKYVGSTRVSFKARFNKPRMGKDVKYLSSYGINKSCRTGKPYKNLIFKFLFLLF